MLKTTEITSRDAAADSQKRALAKFISKALSLRRSISWLSPLTSLTEKASAEFGRNIEKSLNNLSQDNGIVSLKLRNKKTAVVISNYRYEQMLEVKIAYEKLLEIESKQAVFSARENFDNLYHRITSHESLKAADALFSAHEEDLKRCYRPGETEIPE